MSIRTIHDQYTNALPLWDQTQAAIGGKAAILKMMFCLTDPMYRFTEDNREELTLRKAMYWKRARYFNATGRTHDSNDGMIHAKKAEVELPTALDYLKRDATGSGDSLRVLSQKITQDLGGVGRYGCLVDTNQDGVTSKAQEESGEKSPYIVPYSAWQIFHWRVDGGIQEVRLFETYQEKLDEYNYVSKEQIRRLVLIDGVYHNQVFRGGDMVESVTPIMNGSTMKYIPFQFFGADDNSADVGSITLFDLGSQNLGHFTLDADNRDNLHYHGQGMTNIYTDDAALMNTNNPNGLDVGAKGKNVFSKDDRVEILQIEATGAIATEMLRDEQRMVMLGAQLVQNVSTNQTLGAKEIEANATTSVLKRISENASEGIEQLLTWCAGFLGNTEEIKYRLNTEFVTDSMTPEMLAQHYAAVQAGYLPMTTYFESARRAGLTKGDDEELIKDLGEQSMGIQGTTEEMAKLIAENEALKEQLNGGSDES